MTVYNIYIMLISYYGKSKMGSIKIDKTYRIKFKMVYTKCSLQKAIQEAYIEEEFSAKDIPFGRILTKLQMNIKGKVVRLTLTKSLENKIQRGVIYRQDKIGNYISSMELKNAVTDKTQKTSMKVEQRHWYISKRRLLFGFINLRPNKFTGGD